MQAKQSEKLGTFQEQDLFWIDLVNDNGISVRVTNYGCIIQSILVPDRDGIFKDVTLGFDRVEDYFTDAYLAQSPYFGAVVGRYANRIANARYEYQGKVVQLSKNDGENQLHGGGSFSQKAWRVKSVEPNEAKVTFALTSPDGEEGFPGTLSAEVSYQLTNHNELIYEIRAVTDQPTPVNMTNHAYFNLHGDASYVGDHLLDIPANYYFAQDPNLVVTGELVPVAGTPYDFYIPRPIDSNWIAETGYDQAFLIDKGPEWGLIAKAVSKKTGISLEVFSEEPVVQFYTGGFLHGIKGKDGVRYEKFSGFCLETHRHPNAVNIPTFPDTILQPGKMYIQRTAFRFGHSAG